MRVASSTWPNRIVSAFALINAMTIPRNKNGESLKFKIVEGAKITGPIFFFVLFVHLGLCAPALSKNSAYPTINSPIKNNDHCPLGLINRLVFSPR